MVYLSTNVENSLPFCFLGPTANENEKNSKPTKALGGFTKIAPIKQAINQIGNNLQESAWSRGFVSQGF